MNHLKFPLLNPFKFLPNTSSPGIHFDDAWAFEQIKTFETKAAYRHKWVKANTTKLQLESSIAPSDLQLRRPNGTVAKVFAWSVVFNSASYGIYECTFDVSDQPEGIYFLYQLVSLLSVNWEVVSEPIHVKVSWPNTLLYRYYNSFNKDDVAWITGIQMYFRCESGIMDFNPDADASDYIDQTQDRELIDGIPSRAFKLFIGEAPGVAPYIIDIFKSDFPL
jgi:hypothetical protein